MVQLKENAQAASHPHSPLPLPCKSHNQHQPSSFLSFTAQGSVANAASLVNCLELRTLSPWRVSMVGWVLGLAPEGWRIHRISQELSALLQRELTSLISRGGGRIFLSGTSALPSRASLTVLAHICEATMSARPETLSL